jgi:hypothetical protein
LFYADRQIYKQTDVTELRVALRKSANAPQTTFSNKGDTLLIKTRAIQNTSDSLNQVIEHFQRT